MKPFIYAYDHNGLTYYAEGFDEPSIRKAVETKLNIEQGSLPKGRRPDYNKELKEIWNKNNKKMKLFLTKEQTSSKDEIEHNKAKQHCLYELDLLLSEDSNFLSGINDILVKHPNSNVMMYPNTGFNMCYSSNLVDNDLIYRFPKGIIDAYWYVRKNIIELGLNNSPYKRTDMTVLEACDSILAGFNSVAKVDFNKEKVTVEKHTLPISLLHK